MKVLFDLYSLLSSNIEDHLTCYKFFFLFSQLQNYLQKSQGFYLKI
jgi:hypothetical protein